MLQNLLSFFRRDVVCRAWYVPTEWHIRLHRHRTCRIVPGNQRGRKANDNDDIPSCPCGALTHAKILELYFCARCTYINHRIGQGLTA